MKCSNCGKNEVSFTYTSNINGKVTRHQLCSECAQKLGYADSMGSMFARTERMMNRMMGSFFGNSLLPFSTFELPAAETFSLPEAGTGMPVSDGEASHEHTAVEQESARADAVPGADPEMDRRRRINVLRHRMHEAAEREDYETAAKLRDELRQLES